MGITGFVGKLRRTQIYSTLIPHWRIGLLLISLVVMLIEIGRAFFDFTGLSVSVEALPLVNIDAATYQYAGWYITQGGIPYIHMWEIKPPLAWYTTAILAALTGGDMLLLHLLSVAVTCAVMIGCVYLVGALTYRMTNSPLASLIAGLTLLALPGFPYLATLGFRPKYFMLLLGLLSIRLGMQDRFFASGITAAAATGFVLQGFVFPLIAIIRGIRRDDRRHLRHTLAGMLFLTGAAILPILLWRAFIPMLVEVVVAPLLSSESQSMHARALRFLRHTKYALPLAAFGAFGLIRFVPRDRQGRIWLAVGALGFAFQILFLDFDSFPDLFGLHAFFALGVGLLVAHGAMLPRGVLLIIFVPILVVNSVWLGGLGWVFDEASPPAQEPTESVEVRMGLPNLAYLFWNKVEPESCHYRLGLIERQWLDLTGQPLQEAECETQWGSRVIEALGLR